jgi:hypothetical protein
MKKFTLFFLAFIFIFANINAQQRIVVGNNYATPNEVTLVAERGVSTTLKFDLNELNLIDVRTNYGDATAIFSGKAPVILEAGVPEIFYLPTAIIVPDMGAAELEITYGEFTDIENIDLIPSKGNLSRSIDPATVPYEKGAVYEQNAFFPGELAKINETFIMRDVRGLTLFAYPVQYNPVTKVLRIYSEITITVNYTENEGENEFTTQKRHQTIEPEFNAIYNRMFINSSVVQQRGYPTGEAGELLIICHPAFMDAMKPYIDWKRTMGRKTTMVSTAQTTTTPTGIKSFIANYYNNPDNNLAYVLFVGDHAQVPIYPVSGAPSDIEYGKISGPPYLDILIGRMSCENIDHVQTQVQRTIHYERDLTTADTWVSAGIGVARNEGPGHFGEYDHQHINLIRDRMLTYGYNPVWQEYDGGAGVPNTTAAQINQRIDAGTSVLNYCNHGSQTGWSVANYSNANVSQLQNANKLPFLFLVACNNGEFHTGTCFSEVWMRHKYNNQPAGAISVFGATISISWQPPMYAQDEFVNIYLDLPSPYSGTQPGIKRTIAGAMLNASQKMQMVAPSLADYNSWLVFGDPTLNFRTKTPQEMTISHLPVILIGVNSLTVNCDAEGAVATLSYMNSDDEVVIVGSANVAGGVAEINFNTPIAVPMDLTLCVTGFNKVAHVVSVSAIPPSGPYLVTNGYSVVGEEKLTYTSTNRDITVYLKNVGTAATSGTVTVNLNCTDPQLAINNASSQYTASIAPDGTANLTFNVTVSNDILDGKTFPVDVTINCTGVTDPWESKLMLKAFAPEFKLNQVLFDGVENGSLPKGNLAKITCIVENKGGAEAFNVLGKLLIEDDYVIIPCEDGKNRETKNLPAGESMSFDFFVITSPNIPSGYEADINLLINAMYERSYTTSFKAATSGAGNFCIPQLSTGCTSNDKFTSVKLIRNSDQAALINHAPACGSSNGYTDYTNIQVPVNPGEQFTLKVMVGYNSQQMKAWVDANGNNSFETTELLCSGPCGSTGTEYSFPITIPNNFVPGEQRFRLRCIFNSAPTDACNSATYGQTLDYTFIFPELYPRVQNVKAILQGENINITWEAPAEGTPTGYNIYRNGEKLNGTTPLINLTYTEENIEVGIYVYNVTAVYADNKESYSEMSNVICNFWACDAPENLEGSAEGKTAILKWEAPEDIAGTFEGYNIYRNGTKINATPILETEYSDENLPVGTHKYQVSALSDLCGETDKTEEFTITIVPEFCAPPVNVTLINDETSILITWDEPVPENIDGVLLGYNVYLNDIQVNEDIIVEREYRAELTETGSYQVSVVYEHCESELSEEVGIKQHFASSFNIFPNPATNEFTITNYELRITSVEIYDVFGKKLLSHTANRTSQTTINVSHLQSGVYFVKIYTENNQFGVKRLVIVK